MEEITTKNIDKINENVQKLQKDFDRAKEEMGKVIIGQKHLINSFFIALLSNGHILLEGVPGLAKTLSIKTFANILNLNFSRIQFTPDLLPADLIGTPIYNPKEGTFTTKKGPIFTNILLADEINRAPAKVQSALLEVMEEKQATIQGQTFKTKLPFLVLATQNPIEQEGTYPLAEAQTDRFLMKVLVNYPSVDEEREIVKKMGTLFDYPKVGVVLNEEKILEAKKLIETIYIDDSLIDYILNIVFATRRPKQFHVNIEGLLDYGASPRASIYLKMASKAKAFLEGRGYVTPKDIKDIAFDVLRHRLILSYEAEAENISSDEIIRRILDTINIP